MDAFRAVWAKTRSIRAAIAAGALGGLVAGGIGSRVAMRVVAIVDGDSEGRLTDSRARVGEFTVGGTLGLFVVTTIAGVLGGFLYLGIRRWIPATHVPKGLVFGLAVMIVPGIVVFNPDNPDLQMFEPVLLFHALFIGIFLLYGMIVASVAEALHPARPRPPSPRRAGRAIAREAAVLVVLVGLHLFIAGSILEREGTCLFADGKGGCKLRPTDGEGGP